jgi:alanine racemase
MSRPLRVRLHLESLKHNLARLRAHANGAYVWSVIKANAYGHGLVSVAQALCSATDGFAVRDLDEAITLREAGIDVPILLLEGFFEARELELIDQYRLVSTVHQQAQLEQLLAHVPSHPISVYLKVNTGMHRLGFSPREALRAYEALKACPHVHTLTLMTHFANADRESGLLPAWDTFQALQTQLGASVVSVCNSAALLTTQRPFSLHREHSVRLGIALYGASPFAKRNAESLGLRAGMSLTSEIIATQTVAAGEAVGYGATFTAQTPQRIGVVACGYADGYPRHASSGTPVFVDGVRTTTVGRVSMDMLCVDLTALPQAGIGSKVELWGEHLAVDEVAHAAGTIAYELLCAVSPPQPIILMD